MPKKQCCVNYINLNALDHGKAQKVNKFNCDLPSPVAYTIMLRTLRIELQTQFSYVINNSSFELFIRMYLVEG